MCVLLMLPFNAVAATPNLGAQSIDPLQLYGPTIEFDVFRNGEQVGFHRVGFQSNGDSITAVSEFQIEINFLFFTAYSYNYRSEDQWQGGGLARLKAEVNDDGDLFSVAAVRDGDKINIRSTKENYTTAPPLYPTNHWNPGVLKQTRVLNTLTGRVNQVRIEPREREVIQTERGEITATRYAYTGELDTEVWYDDAGRWVRMRFNGKDGSEIDYVCRRCQGPAATTPAP